MLPAKALLFTLILSTASVSVLAQTGTHSPYSRYGLGEVHPQRYGQSRAMGGVAYGLSGPGMINPANPASYAAVDTLSFLFDVGLTTSRSRYTSGQEPGKALINNYAFDHLSLAFHIKPWWVAALGVAPYTKVGYNIKQELDPIPGVGIVDVTNKGSGGINRFFLGSGFRNGPLALGFNLSYLFGTMEQENSLSFPVDDGLSTTISDNQIRVNRFTLETGVQYTLPLSDREQLVFGAVVQARTKMKANRELITIAQRKVLSSSGYQMIKEDTIALVNEKAKFYLPLSIGLGVTYELDKKWLVGLDYTHQRWSNTEFPWDGTDLTNTHEFNAGVQYTPDAGVYGNYFKRVRYRAGVSYLNTNLKLNGKQIRDISFPILCGGFRFCTCCCSFPARTAWKILSRLSGRSVSRICRESMQWCITLILP